MLRQDGLQTPTCSDYIFWELLLTQQGSKHAIVTADIGKTFPSMDHDAVRALFNHVGIPSTITDIILGLWASHNVSYVLNNQTFPSWPKHSGGPQGSQETPDIFQLLVSIATRFLTSLFDYRLPTYLADINALVSLGGHHFNSVKDFVVRL